MVIAVIAVLYICAILEFVFGLSALSGVFGLSALSGLFSNPALTGPEILAHFTIAIILLCFSVMTLGLAGILTETQRSRKLIERWWK